jgi:hypothetical protein
MKLKKIYQKIFSSFNISKDTLLQLTDIKLNQNCSLNYAINELNKKQIDTKKVPLGVLSRLTFTEFTYFHNITFDDIFFGTISFLTLLLLIIQNINNFENNNFKFSDKTKEQINTVKKIINTILGFIYIIYAIYMIKLVLVDKQFILISRYTYLFTYIATGFTILNTLYNDLK